MVYSTGRFVVCLSVCRFVLVFFGPFGVAIASLGEAGGGVWSWCFSYVGSVCACLDLSVSSSSWGRGGGGGVGLRFVIVALSGLFSYFFFKLFPYNYIVFYTYLIHI